MKTVLSGVLSPKVSFRIDASIWTAVEAGRIIDLLRLFPDGLWNVGQWN